MKKIMIRNARLSFPSLFKKAEFNGIQGKYEATLLFPKSDTATYNAIMAEVEEVKSLAKLGKLSDEKLCIKDGDESEYDGYAGMWSIKATNLKRPPVLNRDKTPIAEEDGIIYAGCYVNAIVTLWGQNNNFGKRINSNLLGVQFVKDGEPFGDAVVADADEFDDFSDDDDL